MPETITQDGEVIETGLPVDVSSSSFAVSLTKAEIDQQVATAHAYPRSPARVSKAVFELVTIDEESAKECNYALPRGGKAITGPSIRLAEIVGGQWGNCRVGARVVQVDRAEKFVEAEGIFHDLETNAATTARVRRRIVDSKGRLFNDDMIIMTGNAACSIAKRNAILAGVPKAVWRKAYDAALATIRGDVRTLGERRDRTFKAFAAFGIKPEQIFEAMGVGGIEEIGVDEIATLFGMHTALKSGEATVEEMFGLGKPAEGGGENKNLKQKLNDVADGDKPKDSGDKAKAEGKKADKPKEEKPAADKPSGDGVNVDAESQEEEDDDFPGDLPSGDEIEAAKDAGAEAYHRGQSRKAIPERFRKHKRLTDAWLTAFDEAKAEEEGGSQ